MKTFVEILSERVKAEKIKVSDISRASKVPQDQIYKLVNKKNLSTNVESAIKIASYFGQTLEEFMGSVHSGEEQEILRLANQLTAEDLQQMVGFGKGLLAAQGQSRPKSGEDE